MGFICSFNSCVSIAVCTKSLKEGEYLVLCLYARKYVYLIKSSLVKEPESCACFTRRLSPTAHALRIMVPAWLYCREDDSGNLVKDIQPLNQI